MQTRSDVTAELKKLSRVQQRHDFKSPLTAGKSDDEGFALNRTDFFFLFFKKRKWFKHESHAGGEVV